LFLENFLLGRLERKIKSVFKSADINYVTCFGTHGVKGESLFLDDGIHVSPAGHRRMAELIYPFLKEVSKKVVDKKELVIV